MKIFVDENIPTFTVIELINLGHDVQDIRGTKFEGIDDELIWQKAQIEHRLLVSTDKGFTHYHYQNHRHSGIILVLLKQPSLMKIHQRIMRAVQQFSADELQNTLLIIRDTVISRRK
jgi:predicted nuclease of predicted toxin-antitoxin system